MINNANGFHCEPRSLFATSAAQDFRRLEMMRDRGTTYHNDGTGRDAYIFNDNGGFSVMKKPREQNKPGTLHNAYIRRYNSKPRPRLEAKPFKYLADGSGRDAYIKLNDGGLSNVTVKNSESKSLFVSNLRNNEPNRSYLAIRGYDRTGVNLNRDHANKTMMR